MGLLDRITQLFRRAPVSASEPTTSDEMRTVVSPAGLANRMRADTDRRQTILTCREMYRTDPRARRMMGTLARDSVRGGFTVRVASSSAGAAAAAEAEQAARDLIRRLHLMTRLVDWAKLTMRDGDTFLELSVSGLNLISRVTRKPSLSMRRASNVVDGFDDPARAFWLADDMWLLADPPADAVWFAEWQIVHARYDHDEDSRYGSPMFGSATGAFKRVKEGEVDVAVRRKTRAGMKYVHKFPPGTDRETVEQYMEVNKDALDDQFAAVADFFGTADIAAVQGDARLQEISDVLHHIRTWLTASPVPVSLIGYGQDLNRDVLEQQKEEYGEELDPITQWVEDEFVAPLVERQWLLLGILPESLEYEVEWTVKGKLKAADIRDVSDAALRLQALGVPAPVVVSVLTRFLPGIDLGAMNTPTLPTAAVGTQAEAEAGRLARVSDVYGRMTSGE